MQRDLELVRQEAARAGQIVRNLLSFVRRSSPDRSAGRPERDRPRHGASCASTTSQQRNIALRLELHPGALPVLVNREEIQQIVLNLVLNAEQAIGDAAGHRSPSAPTPASTRTRSQVTDDGPGSAPELRGRVFEPFFTTKEVGQGTGLGLSIALGIATAHGGSLELCRSDDRAPASG